MNRTELMAQPRSVLGKRVKQLRNTGVTPANVYGHDIKSQAIQVDTKVLIKALSKSGETELINLIINNSPHLVIIRNMKIDPVKRQLQHVDFYEVKLTEKIKVEVPIELTGESLEVEKKGGIIIRALNLLQIECLPEQIPHRIEVNISSLKEFGDTIRVKDISIDQAIKTLNDPEQTIVRAEAPRAVEEVAPKPAVAEVAAEAEAEVKEPEVEKEKETKETREKEQENK